MLVAARLVDGAGRLEVCLGLLERLALRVEVRLGNLERLLGLLVRAGDLPAGTLERGERGGYLAALGRDAACAGRWIAPGLGELVLELGELVLRAHGRALGGLQLGVAAGLRLVCLRLRHLEGTPGLGRAGLGPRQRRARVIRELLVGFERLLVALPQRRELVLLGAALRLEVVAAGLGLLDLLGGLGELALLQREDGVEVGLDLAAVAKLLGELARLPLECLELEARRLVGASGLGELAHGGHASRDLLAARLCVGAGAVDERGHAGVILAVVGVPGLLAGVALVVLGVLGLSGGAGLGGLADVSAGLGVFHSVPICPRSRGAACPGVCLDILGLVAIGGVCCLRELRGRVRCHLGCLDASLIAGLVVAALLALDGLLVPRLFLVCHRLLPCSLRLHPLLRIVRTLRPTAPRIPRCETIRELGRLAATAVRAPRPATLQGRPVRPP